MRRDRFEIRVQAGDQALHRGRRVHLKPEFQIRPSVVGGHVLLSFLAARGLIKQQILSDGLPCLRNRIVGRVVPVKRLIEILHDIDDRVGLRDQPILGVGQLLDAIDLAKDFRVLDPVVLPCVEEVDDVRRATHLAVDLDCGFVDPGALPKVF